MAEERLNILKEILSATTVEDAIRLKKKYKDFLVTPDEAEVIELRARKPRPLGRG